MEETANVFFLLKIWNWSSLFFLMLKSWFCNCSKLFDYSSTSAENITWLQTHLEESPTQTEMHFFLLFPSLNTQQSQLSLQERKFAAFNARV